MGMNWRAYGLKQVRGQLPRGAVTLIVHLASVWVPFTSESKEAIASYPARNCTQPEGVAAGIASGGAQVGHVYEASGKGEA